jgi:AsmA protein
MKRAILLIGAGLVTLALLAVAAGGVLLAVVDPNDYKEDISAAVFTATGRRLLFQGDLSLTLYPRPGLKTGAFQIQDQPDFGVEPLLAVRSASLRLALGPLLRGRLEVGEIFLDGLRLKLAESATGRKNWETPRPSAAEGVEELPGEERQAAPSLKLRVQDLRLEDGEAVYRNLGEGTSLGLHLDSLTLRNVALNEEMFLEGQGGLRDAGTGREIAFFLRGRALPGGDGTVSGTLETLNLDMGDARVKTALALRFAAAPGSLQAEAVGKVGETSIQGRADLALPGSGRPGLGVRGELAIGSLNLDSLLAVRIPSALGDSAPAAPAGPVRSPRPVAEVPAALRALDADLRLTVNTLLAARLPLTLVTLQIKAEGGMVTIPYSLKACQGTISGVATADLRPAAPLLGLEGEIGDLSVGDLLEAVSGRRSLSGSLSGSLSFRGRGLDPASLLPSLSGKGEARISGGEVQGFTLIPADLPGAGSLPVNYPLESLSLAFVLNRGQAEIRESSLLSPLLTAKGSGTASLVSGALDLLLRFRPAGAGPEIPLRVRGTFARPIYGVDLAEMGKDAARTVLEAPEDAAKALRGLQKLLPGK